MTTPIIGQANPGAGYRELQTEIDAAVARALASGWYILGAEGRAFEAEYAAWLGTERAVGCANGTDALALVLRGLGVGAGKSVVTVSHTAVATVAAIEMAGATPILVDIEPDTYTLNPTELAEILANPPAGLPPIGAILPVHLYGQCVDWDAFAELKQAHGVLLIEDAAQAFGSTWKGVPAGGLGDAAAFSFYPTKNLSALGDAGLATTNDAAIAERMTMLRAHGM